LVQTSVNHFVKRPIVDLASGSRFGVFHVEPSGTGG
jgi:hypothetical protein